MPKVSISYSYDSDDHKERVLSLVNLLKKDGIDCNIDQCSTVPEEWSKWTYNQTADFLLIICTETYLRKLEGVEDTIITLYESQSRKFIPILFSQEDAESIPVFLRSSPYYLVSSKDGYESLLQHLYSQSKKSAPDASEIIDLEEIFGVTLLANGFKIQDETRVLLYNSKSEWVILKSKLIEFHDRLDIVLIADSPSDTLFLSTLQEQSSSYIGVAFEDIAIIGRTQQVTQQSAPNGASWQVSEYHANVKLLNLDNKAILSIARHGIPCPSFQWWHTLRFVNESAT